MCGRLGRPEMTWAELYALQNWIVNGVPISIERDPNVQDLSMSWNVKPTQMLDMAFIHDDRLISSTARWWLVPHWFKEYVKQWKPTTFNAKIETAHKLGSFRVAWKSSRCIIPASFYYEWTGPKGAKQPWVIKTDTNDPCMYFAGLYSRLSSGLNTCTILTRPALHQIEHIHARSPVILANDNLLPWMTGEIDHDEAQNLGTEWDGRMRYHKVAPIGRDDDGPELIDVIEA